jgi:hypothetical protein
VKLRRPLNLFVQIAGNIVGRCRQIVAGGVDFTGAVLGKA